MKLLGRARNRAKSTEMTVNLLVQKDFMIKQQRYQVGSNFKKKCFSRVKSKVLQEQRAGERRFQLRDGV